MDTVSRMADDDSGLDVVIVDVCHSPDRDMFRKVRPMHLKQQQQKQILLRLVVKAPQPRDRHAVNSLVSGRPVAVAVSAIGIAIACPRADPLSGILSKSRTLDCSAARSIDCVASPQRHAAMRPQNCRPADVAAGFGIRTERRSECAPDCWLDGGRNAAMHDQRFGRTSRRFGAVAGAVAVAAGSLHNSAALVAVDCGHSGPVAALCDDCAGGNAAVAVAEVWDVRNSTTTMCSTKATNCAHRTIDDRADRQHCGAHGRSLKRQRAVAFDTDYAELHVAIGSDAIAHSSGTSHDDRALDSALRCSPRHRVMATRRRRRRFVTRPNCDASVCRARAAAGAAVAPAAVAVAGPIPRRHCHSIDTDRVRAMSRRILAVNAASDNRSDSESIWGGEPTEAGRVNEKMRLECDALCETCQFVRSVRGG